MTCQDDACRSSDGRPRAARTPEPRRRVDPDDLARLNSLLYAGLRFEVDTEEPGGEGTASGVLVCEPFPCRRLTATYPVILSRRRRKLLGSLSRSLAECAMALGLGAGVYSGRGVTRGGRQGRRPATLVPSAGPGKWP